MSPDVRFAIVHSLPRALSPLLFLPLTPPLRPGLPHNQVPRTLASPHAESDDIAPRWILPNYFWTTEQHIGARKLQLVMIDTVLLDEEISRAALLDKIDAGLVHPSTLREWDGRAGVRQKTGEEQLEWLEGVLSDSKADWLVVCGHYPVYSGGEHGSTPSLQAKVRPSTAHSAVDRTAQVLSRISCSCLRSNLPQTLTLSFPRRRPLTGHASGPWP